MRRTDREVRDPAEIIRIVEKCEVCRIALCEGNVPYIVPMNFGFMYTDEKLTLYFHCANEGKKLDIIKQNPAACFEMDCGNKLIAGDDACDYTMEFESVIGRGEIVICEDREEKVRGLSRLMANYVKGEEFTFPDRAIDAVTVRRLTVSEFTGKRLKKG